jgi:hypothetical protein
MPGLGLPELKPDDKPKSLKREQEEVKTAPPPSQVKKGLPFGIPKLNISGLGLSEIVPGTGDPNTPVLPKEEE